MKPGIQEIVCVVEEIDRMRDVFLDVFRWNAIPLEDAPVEQFAAWQIPGNCTRIEQTLLVPEWEQRGALRLVRFESVSQEFMRPCQQTWDSGGIFDIDVYARDARKTFRQLERRGWCAFGPPTEFEWGEFHVCEVLARGPDGLVVALIQPFGKVLIDLPDYTAISRAFNSTQIVRDYNASMQFYLEVLGWQALMDTVVVDVEEPGRDVLGIPASIARTVARRTGIVHPTGTNDGSIELLEMSELGGHDHARRCIAPNIGLLSARIPVDNAGRYADQIKACGTTLYAEPGTLHIDPYGLVTIFAVMTPDGAILEFFSAN